VPVAWSDSLAGCANGRSATFDLSKTIYFLMEIEQKMSAVANLDASLVSDALLVQRLQLLQEGWNMEHDTVSDQAGDRVVQDTGGQQVEGKLFAVDPNSVACKIK
jgi:hypothetical protein